MRLTVLYIQTLLLTGLFLFQACSMAFGQYENTRLDSTYRYTYTSLKDSLPETKSVCSFKSLVNSAECYNFSTCISSSWDAQTRVWTPYFKSEQRWEEEGSKTTRFSYYWNAANNEWTPYDQYFTQKTSEAEERNIYKWDTTFMEWSLIQSVKWQFDERGNNLVYENKILSLEENTWSGYKDELTYDDADRPTSSIHSQWEIESNDWEAQNRHIQTYNSSGYLDKKEEFYWRAMQSTWILSSTETFSYNDQGQKTYADRTYHYDLGSGPIIEQKQEWTYDASGNELEFIDYRLNLTNFEWQVYDHLVQRYDTQNNLLSKSHSYWDWQLDTSYLRETHAYTRTQTAIGEDVIEERYGYNANGDKTYGTLNQYVYDSGKRQLERIRSIRDLDQEIWVPQQKTESPFTSFGYRDFFALYDWNEEKNTWVGRNRTGFDYSSDEIITRRTKAFWREQQGDWFVTSSEIFSYGPCQRENLVPARNGSLLVYPNPTTGTHITIESKLPLPFTYAVVNLQGQKQLKGEIHSLIQTLDISSLTGGTYILHCRSGNSTETQKFSVTRR